MAAMPNAIRVTGGVRMTGEAWRPVRSARERGASLLHAYFLAVAFLAVLVLGGALFASADARAQSVAQGVAQDLCADPATVCSAKIEPRCLSRVGAGSIAVSAADDACAAQFAAYSDCLVEATQCPDASAASAVGPQRDRCPPFVEQTLFEAAQADPTRRGDFLAACPGSPLTPLLPPPAAPVEAPSSEAPTRDVRAAELSVRSGEAVVICTNQERAPIEVSLRVWKRNATTPDVRATLVARDLSLETTIRVGQRVDLTPKCAIELVDTSFRGRFFAEIAIYK